MSRKTVQQLALETPQRLDTECRAATISTRDAATSNPSEAQDQPSRTLSTHIASRCTQPVDGTVKRWLAGEVLECHSATFSSSSFGQEEPDTKRCPIAGITGDITRDLQLRNTNSHLHHLDPGTVVAQQARQCSQELH